ncbi:MAG: transcriptional regulator [Alphaproteobacteria bacterium]|nr:MAG: transcriptional regulator [Alphaproteobacteria bacterium]
MPQRRLTFGPFQIDQDAKVLLRDGAPLAVGQRGAMLFEALLSRPGEVITKSELLDAAWGGAAVEESNLTVQVAALRKVLGRSPTGGDWIVTVPRVGYDRQRMKAGDAPERDLFVDDERTAIDWLADFLKSKPSTYQEVHPEFTQKTGASWRKHEERPELAQLLEENFLKFDGTDTVPSQIHTYLSSNWREMRSLDKDAPALIEKARNRWYVPDPNKQQDVEKRREKALLREFEQYKTHKGKKLKEIRLEVMRAGFKAAWAAKDFQTIVDVAAKVPEDAWQEDERLLMYHSMAGTRLEAGRSA